MLKSVEVNWSYPSPKLTLTGDAVHVWLARLDLPNALLLHLESSLSPDEKQRADRFAFDRLRAHFIAGRGILRHLLGRYMALPPHAVRFVYNQQGKPALDPGAGSAILSFNVSHSNGLALFAFTRNSEIGVDIEYMQDRTDIEQSGAIVFSPPELASIQAQPPAARRAAFFRLWARKEAFIKALGLGFSAPLLQYDVSRVPETPVIRLTSISQAETPTNVYVRDFLPSPGFIAAIAREGNTWPLSFFLMPEPDPEALFL